jgi:hypothetical protein
VVALAGALLVFSPAAASADVIFDPADADELASVLAEAYTDQGVCYGWHVNVDNVGVQEESVGSNFGAGKSADTGSCKATVEFWANITYTSESSESEDSSSYDVHSTPSSVTRDDLDALGLDFDGLTGEDPDVVVGKAVTALPLLAADKGIATPLSAAPETATAPADAQLTDDPGSDWWRESGGMLIWALVLMAASGLLIWWILRVNRRRRPATVAAVPDYVPEPWEEQATAAPWESEAEPPSTEDEVEEETPATEPPAAKPTKAAPPAAAPPAAAPAGAEPSVAEPTKAAPPGAAPPGAAPPVGGPPRTEPASAESPAAEPPAEESAASESGAATPPAAEPTKAEPPAAEPPADESAAADSATAEPPAAEPSGAEPASAKPDGDEPPPQKPTSSDESTKE